MSRTGTKLNEFARVDATLVFTAGIVAQVPRLVEPKSRLDARAAGTSLATGSLEEDAT
jgi:hypothetical protein